MSLPISSISSAINTIQPVSGAAAQTGKPGAFQSLLENAIYRVEQFRSDANQATGRLLSGEDEDVHTAALATERAELAFELGLQIRNKVVDAYQEVMRMQL
ncbi:MAG: flagellar hook-basal body complex protein FliE [Acidobacteria bacterium]|nr:flagellar hook-basal body complex protein FliE [Acidobacteriota bacterium]